MIDFWIVNRFRSQGNYVCQALIISFKFVVPFLVLLFICIYWFFWFLTVMLSDNCGGEIKLYHKWTYIRNVMHYALVIDFRLTSSYACDIFFLCWFTTLTTHSSILRLSSKDPMADVRRVSAPALHRVPASFAIRFFRILKPRLHDTTCCQSGCQTGLSQIPLR